MEVSNLSIPVLSDIDPYFNSPRVSVTDTHIHKDELPQMAVAAKDYLAVPASEVAVERLFNAARGLLGDALTEA
ncbi:hypothetical protein DPV78_003419 [Talaromyces pinophilus]|nr:hypothetical protein DPV78_003419 [Talaromyces pinophilus]